MPLARFFLCVCACVDLLAMLSPDTPSCSYPCGVADRVRYLRWCRSVQTNACRNSTMPLPAGLSCPMPHSALIGKTQDAHWLCPPGTAQSRGPLPEIARAPFGSESDPPDGSTLMLAPKPIKSSAWAHRRWQAWGVRGRCRRREGFSTSCPLSWGWREAFDGALRSG